MKNPPSSAINKIINSSSNAAAKWLKDETTGDMWFWPAEQAFHATVAKRLGVDKYEKGIAVTEQ